MQQQQNLGKMQLSESEIGTYLVVLQHKCKCNEIRMLLQVPYDLNSEFPIDVF